MIEELNKKIEQGETAVLVALIGPHQKEETVGEYIDELEFLAKTLGVETVNIFTQKLDKPDKMSFVGKGKLEDIIAFVKAKNRGFKSPFYPDTKIIKDVTPAKFKCRIMELRVYTPIALRVYFCEKKDSVFYFHIANIVSNGESC